MTTAIPILTFVPVEEYLCSPVEIGDIIRTYRERVGWSIYDLGEAIDRTASTISRIENGAQTTGQTLRRIASALQIPLDMIGLGGGSSSGKGKTPPPGGLPPMNPTDEQEQLRACWELFYRGASRPAIALALQGIARLTAAYKQYSDGAILRFLGRFHQVAAVLNRDLGNLMGAGHHGQQALTIARQQREAEALASALFRSARIMSAAGDYPAALRLSEEAVTLAPRVRSPLRGYVHQNIADRRADAQEGTLDMALRDLDRARQTLKGVPEEDESFTKVSEAGISHDEAQFAIAYGAGLSECLHAIERARRLMSPADLRWQTSLTITESLAYARHGQIDSAVNLAEGALTALGESQSQRKKLQKTLVHLQQYAPANPLVLRLGMRFSEARA